MRRPILSLLAVLATMAFIAPPLSAQQTPPPPSRPVGGGGGTSQAQCGEGCGEGDEVAPWVTLLAPDNVIYTATATMSVDWCDNVSLNSATKWVKVNGVSKSIDYVSQSPGDCGEHYTSTTSSAASFNLGDNTVSAHICDEASNCTTESWTITRLAGDVTPKLGQGFGGGSSVRAGSH